MKRAFLICTLLIFLGAANLFSQTAAAPAGDGSCGNPYQIDSLPNLYWVTQNMGSWTSYFIQTSDIDAAESSTWACGTGFTPIGNGTNTFQGSYDGQGHTIDSLYILNNISFIGLFGFAQGGTIKNLGLVDVNIAGYAYVGGLVGLSAATIMNCYSTGTVTGTAAWDGGLVALDNGTVTDCYSAAHVSGGVWVGGLVGGTYQGIDNSYALGSVNGVGAGGLVGKVLLTISITNCYSVAVVTGGFDDGGLVGDTSGSGGVTVSNSFWNVQTSGQSVSAGGGTGDSTDAMKMQSTYTDAGWDFTNVWTIDPGVNRGYPSLQGVAALPVELVSFTVAANQRNAVLSWRTATEVQNSGFEVQRSVNRGESAINGQELAASNWTKAGFVRGSGTSNSPKNYSFTDNVGAAGTYSYRLKQIDRNGAFTYSKTVTINLGGAPNVFALGQNYPNPFNPSTNIQFTVPADGRATLKIFNALGEEVATLFDGAATAGENHQATFDASRLASGIYFSRLEFNGRTQVKKMMLVK